MTRPYRRWDGSGTRVCARCQERKLLELFRLQDGRPRSYCIPCGNAVNQEWRARHHLELLYEAASKRSDDRFGPDGATVTGR